MGKKKEIKLPKSVKKSGKKVQEKYVKAYKKSFDKHQDADRAHRKALAKLAKKYEKVGKCWVEKETKTKSKKTVPQKKTEQKKSVKRIAKKDSKKKTKSDELFLEILNDEDTDSDVYEGANPEEAEDPVAVQETVEDALTEPDLAAALEQDGAVRSLTPERLIGDVTRAQLYQEAQELKIPGRSSMNKEELFTAVELARSTR